MSRDDPAPAGRPGGSLDMLAGGGEMGALMRDFDWTATPVGPPETWSQALRTIVRLLLTTRHPMFLFWGEAAICFYNDAYSVTLGLERHPGSLGRPAREVWDEIWPVIGPQLDQVMSGGEATWFEDQCIPMTRAGRRENRWWTYGYSPVDDPTVAGGIGGALVVCNDVTREHEDREALRRAEERARLALTATDSLGTWDWDIGSDMVRTDARFARNYGVDPEAAEKGVPIAEFTRNVHPDDREHLGVAIEAAMRGGGGEEFAAEYRIMGADGVYRWVAARGRCHFGPDGAPVRFPGVSIDITERKKAEAALERLNETLELRIEQRTRELRKSEARASVVFDLSPDYLFLVEAVDAGGVRFADINPTCERLFGLDRGAVLGRTPSGILPAQAAADIERHARACLATGATQFYQVTRNYSEDREVVIDASVGLIERLENGGGLVLFSGRDVTAQRRVEEQLRQSQKMEAVGQLTGGLAHDFNNLLTGISGSLEMLQIRVGQGRLADVDRYVVAALGAARRAAALTHRLLAFSRRQTLEPKPTDVNGLVGGMEELIRRTVGPAIAVETTAASDLWTILVDPSQLENALLNLCINARDAMPDGGTLTIVTGNTVLDARAARDREVPPGSYVTLCVTDDGTGMPPDVIAQAFDPFFTTKPIGQGTGLGLSMIYGFVRQSGGQVRIDSEVGGGTDICLYLPRHVGEAEHSEAVVPATELSTAPRGTDGDTVLVVDDEPTVRMLVVEVLETLGYTAIEAHDGATGLEILRSDVRIDLLVTDVGLPGGMNGRQVADAARVLRPGLEVLFITGYAEQAVLGQGHLDPGMHVMTKPFAMEALASRIRSLLAG